MVTRISVILNLLPKPHLAQLGASETFRKLPVAQTIHAFHFGLYHCSMSHPLSQCRSNFSFDVRPSIIILLHLLQQSTVVIFVCLIQTRTGHMRGNHVQYMLIMLDWWWSHYCNTILCGLVRGRTFI